VPDPVTGDPDTDKMLTGAERPTEVTVPEPATAQVPSARRKLVVPPPEAGTKPCREELNRFKAAVAPAALVAPVPPLANERVPARVMVPVVVIGPPVVVRPVVPPLTSIEVTVPPPPAPLVQLVLVPSVVRTWPAWVAWDGARALNAAFALVCPVPPFRMGRTPVTALDRGIPVKVFDPPSIVLLVRVSVPASVTTTPEVGKRAVLFCPVPPLAVGRTPGPKEIEFV
jgi:hypothetical protein